MITSLQPLFMQHLLVRKYNLSDLGNETLMLGLENEYVSGHSEAKSCLQRDLLREESEMMVVMGWM